MRARDGLWFCVSRFRVAGLRPAGTEMPGNPARFTVTFAPTTSLKTRTEPMDKSNWPPMIRNEVPMASSIVPEAF